MRYRIGEVAKILGLSPETLRFFEVKGIVSPQHDPRSAYRYYDSLDVNKLVAYLNYRRMGFTLDKAVLLVSGRDLSFLRGELDQQRAAITAERERLARVQSRVECLSSALESMERLRGNLEIKRCPSLCFFANQDDRAFRISESTVRDTRLWLRELPTAFPYALLEWSGPGTKVQWGFAKPFSEGAPKTGSVLIPPESCLHGFFLVPEGDPLFAEAREAMVKWSLAHEETLSGRPHGTILHELEKEGKTYRLFELYAPIREG